MANFRDKYTNIIGGGSGSGLTHYFQNTDFNVEVDSINSVDTTTGIITATLPDTPSDGARFVFTDAQSNFDTNALVLTLQGGNTINNETGLTLNTRNGTVQLVFNGNNYAVYGDGSGNDSISSGVVLSYFYS